MLHSRRECLAVLSAGLGLATGGRVMAGTHAKAGIQLYTLRAAMQHDVAGTLKRVAAVGYAEVEFAGYFGQRPSDIRRMVADLGMTAPSSHVDALAARDAPLPLIDGALEAGHKFLVIAWTPLETRKTTDDWKAWADVCNRFADECHEAGLRFCYHNHNFEFQPVGGVLPYDILLTRADAALVQFELDLYWAKLGGADLGTLLSRHRGRFPMCHVKDMAASGAMADIGQGTIDFKALFARPDVTPFEHYFFENDDAKSPFESAEISYKALSGILESLPERR